MRIMFVLMLVATPAFAEPPAQRCVDVKVGTAQSYDCLNQQLRATSEQAHRSNDMLQAAPYSATSPPNETGQFDETATRNRLGANFGKSVTPPRPAQNFGGPFVPRRGRLGT